MGNYLPRLVKTGSFIHREIVCTFCIQKLDATDVYKSLYTKVECNWCIQNVYNMYTTFQQTFVYILYTKLEEPWQLNSVYKVYVKVCWNVGYIFYTYLLYTFCIHWFWSTKSVHHKNYVYNLYTKFMQNVYKNNLCKMDPTFQYILNHLLCTCYS